jgi:hypothetical protein
MESIENRDDNPSVHPLAATWNAALATAGSEREVLAVVKDYLSRWSPSEIAALPEDCRPGRMAGADDVAELAFKLSQAQCASGDDVDQGMLLERIGAFFAHASARLTQLLASEHTPAA